MLPRKNAKKNKKYRILPGFRPENFVPYIIPRLPVKSQIKFLYLVICKWLFEHFAILFQFVQLTSHIVPEHGLLMVNKVVNGNAQRSELQRGQSQVIAGHVCSLQHLMDVFERNTVEQALHIRVPVEGHIIAVEPVAAGSVNKVGVNLALVFAECFSDFGLKWNVLNVCIYV